MKHLMMSSLAAMMVAAPGVCSMSVEGEDESLTGGGQTTRSLDGPIQEYVSDGESEVAAETDPVADGDEDVAGDDGDDGDESGDDNTSENDDNA